MNKILEEKYNKLLEYIKSLKSAIVAYSGGVDSTLLLKVCVEALGKDKVIAVTAVSDSFAKYELEESREIVKQINAEQLLIYTEEMKDENYIKNTELRCYYCKQHINSMIKKVLTEKQVYNYIVNGTNIDDFNDYRPGIKANKEHDIITPFVEAKLNKQEIRDLSKLLGLKTWNKPAKACLSTRIPTGNKITIEKLKQIEESEKILLDLGFYDVRVRHFGHTAKIEISPTEFHTIIKDDIRNKIIKNFSEIGFKFVTLDLKGYKTGNMNFINS